MKQQDKELLLKDLCARLPYGVKFESYDNIPIVEYCICDKVFIHEQGYIIIELLDKDFNGNTLASISINLTIVSRLPKPYLRPMSSMTEEEESRYNLIQGLSHLAEQHWTANDGNVNRYSDAIDWLNQHHFDHRGLIEKGLALEAKKGMYKIK